MATQDSYSQPSMPPQEQDQQPGKESEMHPSPQVVEHGYKGSGKLLDKVAIITGGDSGIGRAIAVLFAKEGADIVISYLNEYEDAEETTRMVEAEGRRCIAIPGDVGDIIHCQEIVNSTMVKFHKINIVVNNAAEQHEQEDLTKISSDQLLKTFRTNIFSYFYLTQAALCYMKAGSCIINTTSVTAYRGSPKLIDYAATKGAIVAFTRSLAMNLVDRDIRVNAVAPGPIWTPLIPASFEAEHVSHFGEKEPMKRPGQPSEVAPCYVFLASEDASYFTGQVLHPNGGAIVNG